MPGGVNFDINVTAVHAASPLSIETYVSNNDEVTEPDVVYVPGGWNGYEYWMAAVPYPNSNDDYENPSVWASDDGLTWVVPGTNPVEPAPTNPYHNYDPDMVLVGDTMYLFWGITNTGNYSIKYRTSTDGVTWSSATTTLGPLATSADDNVSFGMIYEEGVWKMLYISQHSSPNSVLYRQSTNLTSWTSATATDFPLTGYGTGREPWHLDLIALNPGNYLVIVSDTELDLGSTGRLWLAKSTSLTSGWTLSTQPLLDLHPSASWGANKYRSTGFVEAQDGGGHLLRVWYTGKGTLWQVGYTEISLHMSFPEAGVDSLSAGSASSGNSSIAAVSTASLTLTPATSGSLTLS